MAKKLPISYVGAFKSILIIGMIAVIALWIAGNIWIFQIQTTKTEYKLIPI